MGHGAAGLRSPVEAWLRCGRYGVFPEVRAFLGGLPNYGYLKGESRGIYRDI